MMENWGKCKACKYGEPPEHGWKWHCTWYGTYEDPDELQNCQHYTSRDSSGGSCFLTTACCEYKGLPDDCHELQTMRKLRDEYILKKPYGRKLVDDYYKEAPAIVDAIHKSIHKDEILEETYQKIGKIVDLGESGEYDEAVICYMMLIHDLTIKLLK